MAEEQRDVSNSIEPYDEQKRAQAPADQRRSATKKEEAEREARRTEEDRLNAQNAALHNSKPNQAKTASEPPPDKPHVPDKVSKSYVEMKGKYYFQGRPGHVAFHDKGDKLKTKLSNKKVSASMIDMAEARGWTAIKAKGTKEFRQQVWVEASRRGLNMKGYKPSKEDLARLEKMNQERKPNEIAANTPKRGNQGHANQNGSNPGSHPTSQQPGNQEKAQALKDKDRNAKELVREHPDMVNEAATLKVAEKFSERLRDDKTRERFMREVRESLSQDVTQGRRAPEVRVRETRKVERSSREAEVENER